MLLVGMVLVAVGLVLLYAGIKGRAAIDVVRESLSG